jgi:hypothetical protein
MGCDVCRGGGRVVVRIGHGNRPEYGPCPACVRCPACRRRADVYDLPGGRTCVACGGTGRVPLGANPAPPAGAGDAKEG